MADNLSESPSATTKAEHDIQRLRLFKVVPLVCSYLGKASSRRFGKPVNYWGTRIPFCPAMRLSRAFVVDHHDPCTVLHRSDRKSPLLPIGDRPVCHLFSVTFRTRGLDTTLRPESPIHTAPVNQTWGLREFAVTDPDGNGLCFCMPVKSAQETSLGRIVGSSNRGHSARTRSSRKNGF